MEEDTTFYRVYGGAAEKVGSFMSRTPQNGGLQSQLDLAIKPEWGNELNLFTKVTVPKGTKVYEGIAGPQSILDRNGNAIGFLPGGGNQIYIKRKDRNDGWFK